VVFTSVSRKISGKCGVFAYEHVHYREGKLMKRFAIS